MARMKDSSRALLGASAVAYLVVDTGHWLVTRGGEHQEPMRVSIAALSTSGNATPYNLTITTEDVMQPLRVVGQAPTPDLNTRVEMIVRRINRG
jgi:hypothetical protein